MWRTRQTKLCNAPASTITGRRLLMMLTFTGAVEGQVAKCMMTPGVVQHRRVSLPLGIIFCSCVCMSCLGKICKAGKNRARGQHRAVCSEWVRCVWRGTTPAYMRGAFAGYVVIALPTRNGWRHPQTITHLIGRQGYWISTFRSGRASSGRKTLRISHTAMGGGRMMMMT